MSSDENAKSEREKNESWPINRSFVCDCMRIIFLTLHRLSDTIWRNEDKSMHTNQLVAFGSCTKCHMRQNHSLFFLFI